MTTTPDMDAAIEAAAHAYSSGYDSYPEPARRAIREEMTPIVHAVLATVHPTITTAEELDALPDGTVVGAAWATHQRVLGSWVTFGGPDSMAVELPVTVLYRGDAQ